MTNLEIASESLMRARSSQSLMNYAAIYEGFAAKGIPASDIQPRENVLTFHAWKALGRSVRKGEHGVKVVTFVPMSKRDDDGTETTFRRPKSTTVFHISQTDPVKDRAEFVRDPGEDAADRWNETHGDRY